MTTFKKKLKGLLSAWLVVAILAISVVPGVTMTAYAMYSVAFTPNGGSGEMSSITTSSLTITLPDCTFTPPSGKVFSCWTYWNKPASGYVNALPGDSVTLTPGYLTVTALWETPIIITSQPQNATAVSGETAIFSVSASGTGLTYKWQYQPAGGSTWSDCSTGCSNANTATMTVTSNYSSSYNTNGTKYRCVISDTASNSLTSDVVTLTVTAPAHTHQWSYSVKDANEDGDRETLVATCSGTGTCDATNKTLTINPPLHEKVNDGKSAAATLSAASVGGITSFPAIVYQKYTQYPTLDSSSTTTTPPEVGGKYKASLTVGGVTAYVNYTIEKNTRPSLKMFTITDVTSDSFVINLHQDDLGKTDFICQISGVYDIAFTPDASGRATITVPDTYIGESNLMVVIKQKETDYYKASNQVVYNDLDLLPLAHPAPAAGEGFSIDYANETITVPSGYEAFSDSAATVAIASGSTVTPGATIYIRKAASGTMLASATTANTLAARPAVPTGLTKTDETIKDKRDGSLTGLNSTMEYKFGENEWRAATDGGSLRNIRAGSVIQVRTKATATSFAGEIVSFTIAASDVTLSLTYDLNGGTATGTGSAFEPKTGLSYNTGIGAPPATLVKKTGCVLLGWSTDPSATTAEFAPGTDTIYVTENITLYAVWQGKADVAITSTTAQNAGTYDGTPKSFNITNDLGLDASSFTVKYIYKPEVSTYATTPVYVTPQNAGYYDVEITRDEDDTYASFSLTIPNGLYIAPKVVEIAWSDLSHIYNGYEKSATATVTNIDGSDVVNLTLSGNTATNAGNYTATVTGLDNSNYTISGVSNLSQAWSIDPKQVQIAWSNLTHIYDGYEKWATAEITNAVDSDDVYLALSGDRATLAGDYTAEVTGISGTAAGNYVLGTTGLQQAWSIAKRPVTIRWDYSAPFDYDGTEKTVNAWIDDNLSSGMLPVEPVLADNAKTNAGDYTANVTGLTGSGAANYTLTGASSVSLGWTIAPKALDSSAILPVGEHEFTGSAITPAVSVRDGSINLVRGTDFNIVSYTNNKNIGRATFEIEFIGNYTGRGSGSFSIIDTMPGGIVFTVTFDSNGGSTVKEKRVHRLQRLEKPEDPEREGFIFAGWYVDSKLTEKYDFDASVMDHMTLYAKWTAEETEEEKETGKEENKPSIPDSWKNPFSDVKSGDWFYGDVEYAHRNGLMNGTSANTFSPNGAITRAMLVTVLYRNEGSPEVSGTSKFADVVAGSYYEKAVIWAEKYGIVKGYSETEFRPDTSILREQIAAIMFRYANYKGYTIKSAELDAFTDASDISGYAVDAVKYAVATGLIKGKGANTIKPLDTATRAEIAAILKRFINANK